MSWSFVKEEALRSLRPVGSEYGDWLALLSDVPDEDVPKVVARIREARSRELAS